MLLYFKPLIFSHLVKVFLKKNCTEKMHKVKTNSGAKKRFRITATGKIKRKHAYKNHILTKKSTKRKKRLTKMGFVDSSDVRRIKDLLKI